jgi:hypothetical protein
MVSPDPIQRFLFIAPLILVPLILILIRFPWRMILLVWLAGTFIQELLFGLYVGARPLATLLLMILYLYPFALFPLGLWSAILGIVCWVVAVRMRWPLHLQRSRQLLLGLVCGALIGATFSFAVAELTYLVGPTSSRPGIWLVWEIGGAVAGGVDGAIIASFLPQDRETLFRWVRPTQARSLV